MSSNPFDRIIVLITLSAILLGVALLAKAGLDESLVESDTVNSVVCGEITNKYINTSGLTGESQYKLTLEIEYEFDGKSKTTSKVVSVDKETYLDAEIGEIFNMHTLESTSGTNHTNPA